MRLGQLARKLAISPTEIVKFLESNSIPASEGSNTRLTDEHTQFILRQFDPTGSLVLTTEQSDEVDIAPEAAPAPVAEEAPAPIIEAETVMAEVEPVQPAAEASAPEAGEATPVTDEETTELPDVIKAQKVALAGLKVLGKIELPGPKKKEPAPEDSSTPENTTDTPEAAAPTPQPERRPRRERDGDRREGNREGRDREGRDGDGRRSRRNDNNRRNDKPRKNPVALQREREAHEAELKREAQAKAEKERRTQHYQNRVKSVPTKPARLLREQTEEMTDDHTPLPKTWIGKFWKWFRS